MKPPSAIQSVEMTAPFMHERHSARLFRLMLKAAARQALEGDNARAYRHADRAIRLADAGAFDEANRSPDAALAVL